jgi:hypothetical protein
VQYKIKIFEGAPDRAALLAESGVEDDSKTTEEVLRLWIDSTLNSNADYDGIGVTFTVTLEKFKVSLVKAYQTLHGPVYIQGSVSLPSVEDAEEFRRHVGHRKVQTTDERIVWESEPEEEWEYLDFTFQVVEG